MSEEDQIPPAAAESGDQVADTGEISVEISGEPAAAQEQAPAAAAESATAAEPPAAPESKNGKVAASGDDKSSQSTDKYEEAENLITWERDAAVKIRFGEGMSSMPAITVNSMLKSSVKKSPNAPALSWKENGKWLAYNMKQYYDSIVACAKSFIKLGLEPYKGVAILGFNSKEWFFSNFGAIMAGGLSVGTYTTNSSEACAYVATSSESQIIMVENDAQMKKILEAWDTIPSLKAVVQWQGKPSTDRDNVYCWEDFIKLGEDVEDSVLQERVDNQFVNKCCALIYTSGTTGRPKGVMLSHDNITYACRVIGQFVDVGIAKESIISYLPLSHIAAQLLDMYLPVCYASLVYFAQPDALKGTLNVTMKETQPTIFFGVPRVFEKMEEKIKATLREATGLKKKLADWAKGVASKTAVNMQHGSTQTAWGYSVANVLLYKKIRVATGLTKCTKLYSGAAPLNHESHEYFASVGMPVMEAYGMSECTGVSSMTIWEDNNRHWKPGSAGYRLNGYEYDLLNKDEKGNGEIAMIGRHLFMGYLGEEEKTKDTFDEDFRLKSGDIGITDNDGLLFISGRIKELLITAGGENVAPVPIEDIVKEELPVVANCMLVGDRKKFLSLLITLKAEVDMEVMRPTEDFTADTIAWCKSLGSEATKIPDIMDGKDEKVTKALQAGIDKANARSESRAKKIAKFTILPIDFSIFGGELGPTLKLKRPVVTEKYNDVIEALYAE